MQNIRYALRSLIQRPLFTFIVVLTFALGIGANTAVFTVVNAVVLRPLPFKQPERLVAIGGYDLRQGPDSRVDLLSISYPNFLDWRAQTGVFEKVAVYFQPSLTLTDAGQAMHIQGGSVSADLFSLLGVSPVLGRAFLPNEDEPGHHVAILGYDLWQNHFGGNRDIIGKPIMLDGLPFEVVGVMPPHFTFPIRASAPELWTTVSRLREPVNGAAPMTEQRENDFLGCVARLKPNASVGEAQANIDTINATLRRQYPETSTNLGAKVTPLLPAMVAGARPAFIMLCAMAACVLLVACVNVANLLLARSISRQREISIRAALGADRWQIIKQLLIESALLGLGGGIVGFLIAIWGLDLLKTLLPSNIPRITELSPDPHVLTFAALISLAVGIFSGLLPAWRASHPNLVGSLNEATRGSTEGLRGARARGALVVVEIVLALVLLASAGLLVRSFLRLQKVPPGFEFNDIITARIALPDSNYSKPEKAAAFYSQLLDRVSLLPGVEAVGAGWWLPLSGSEIEFSFDIQQHPVPKGEQPVAQVNVVTPDYFKALRVPVLSGRAFTPNDDGKAPPVMVVTESFAKQYFPGENPIGKRVTLNGSVNPGDPPVREIVGVVGDMHLISLRESPKPQIYVPHRQFAIQSMSIFVRSHLELRSLTAALENEVGKLDKDVPVYRPRHLSYYVSQSVAQPRLNATLVGLFAAIALSLAAAGIFGVMSYSVTQRTQEIGIRLALGAQRADVLRLIVGQGMRLVGFGLVLGFAGVIASARLLQSLLFGIGATDLTVMCSVGIILASVAFVACWFPAFRASQVNPVTALRAE